MRVKKAILAVFATTIILLTEYNNVWATEAMEPIEVLEEQTNDQVEPDSTSSAAEEGQTHEGNEISEAPQLSDGALTDKSTELTGNAEPIENTESTESTEATEEIESTESEEISREEMMDEAINNLAIYIKEREMAGFHDDLDDLDSGFNANDFDFDESMMIMAQALDAKPIKYCVSVNFGTFKYRYDYGDSWNTKTHSYTKTSGWNVEDIYSNNCKIEVQNYSNYPVTIDVSSSLIDSTRFNANPTKNGSVIGVFSYSLDAIKDSGYEVLKKGYGNVDVGVFPSRITTDLDCFHEYQLGTSLYCKLKDGLMGRDVDAATYFFAYSGKLDSNIQISPDENVGVITVKVAPVDVAKVDYYNSLGL